MAFVPDQLPLAVQDLALVDDQVSVEDPLYDTDVGLAEILTVGAGEGGGTYGAPKTFCVNNIPTTKTNNIKSFLYIILEIIKTYK
jgi:hypothetical protein